MWPLSLLVLVLAPWVPVPLPAAVLAWSGRTALIVWVAIVAIMLATGPRFPPLTGTRLRGPALAGLLAFTLGALAFWQIRPLLPSGD